MLEDTTSSNNNNNNNHKEEEKEKERKLHSKSSSNKGSLGTNNHNHNNNRDSSDDLDYANLLQEVFGQQQSMSMPTLAPSQDGLEPTPPVTAFPTSPPSPLSCSDLPRTEALLQALSTVTEEELLLDGETPQGMAFMWLLDETSSDPCDPEAIVQRYAVGTLYYATQGDNWKQRQGWLSSASECEWQHVKCEELLVTELELGT